MVIRILFVSHSPAMEALYLISGFTTWTTFGNSAAHTTPNTSFWFFELMFSYKNGKVTSKTWLHLCKMSMPVFRFAILELSIPITNGIKRSWPYPWLLQKVVFPYFSTSPVDILLLRTKLSLWYNKRASKIHFHTKGCKLGLVLKQMKERTRKLPSQKLPTPLQ